LSLGDLNRGFSPQSAIAESGGTVLAILEADRKALPEQQAERTGPAVSELRATLASVDGAKDEAGKIKRARE